MKKFFGTLAICMMAFMASAVAQNLQEVVYLKNGSIIKGIVIEQTPGVSLKIKTYDGSIFAYQMSDVEKITKEKSSESQFQKKSSNIHYQNTRLIKLDYRGFIDYGYTFGAGAGRGIDKVTFTTSHGAQVLPFLYVGAGAGINFYHKYDNYTVPLFANIRTDILPTIYTPFFDVKIGYSIGGVSGFYFSPSIGCHFKDDKGSGWNIGVGYVMQRINLYYGEWKLGDINVGGICLKIGVSF